MIRAAIPLTLCKLCRSLNKDAGLRAKSRADAVHLLPIYTVRKIVMHKSLSLVYFKPTLGTPGALPYQRTSSQ